MSTTTRFLGNCPVCEGDFKLHNDKLVHHGYQRPGDGMIHGDCFCVGMDPYEVSPKGCELYKVGLQAQLANLQDYLAQLEGGEVVTLTKRVPRFSSWREIEFISVHKAENPHEFAQLLFSEINGIKTKIVSTDLKIARMDRRITTWTPKPIRTVEEETAKKVAKTEARKAAKKTERQEKVAARIARFQARIDSAVRRKNASSLATIWEKINGDLFYELKLSSKEEAVRLIDRDHVWALFGLVAGGTWHRGVGPDEVFASNREIMQRMRWEEKFWPEPK